MSQLKYCRVCDSTRLEPAIDLGKQPWCNDFLTAEQVGKEEFYPLQVVYCFDCATAQLDFTVCKETMFGDHTYLSGITKTLSNHFQTVAKYVDEQFFAGVDDKAVLDIGSNDGTQLKHFAQLGWDVVGVECSKTTAQIANDNGVYTINDYFNLDLARQLGRPFQAINAAGVFFHLEELHSVCDGIREALADNGVFVVQFLYMKSIVENLAFDQIYHEHLLYYTLVTIEKLLNRHGLSMFDAYLSPIHGGSIVGFITHRENVHSGEVRVSERLAQMREAERLAASNDFATYVHFAERIKAMKEENLEFLAQAKAAGKTIFGFGAPAKGNTLLNYFQIGTNYLDCLVEKNSLRKGLYSPGMHLPIVMENELSKQPDLYYVLAWNFKEEILANNQNLLNQGVEFFFPVNPPANPMTLNVAGVQK